MSKGLNLQSLKNFCYTQFSIMFVALITIDMYAQPWATPPGSEQGMYAPAPNAATQNTNTSNGPGGSTDPNMVNLPPTSDPSMMTMPPTSGAPGADMVNLPPQSSRSSGAPNASMVNLPPLPKVDTSVTDDDLNKVMNDSLKAQQNAARNDAQNFVNFIPWREGFGDPKDPNFQKLLKQQFPMSPEQIKIFRETLNIYEQAMQDQVRNPTPMMSTRSVNLDPGGTPPPVRISTGYVSSVLFIDETGAAWPIKAYDIGNSKAFNVQWDKKSNILMIQGLVPYSNTNIVVLLHNLETPVILNLINDQQKVDYRLDLRVPGMGPKATVPIITNTEIPNNDGLLMGLIDGIPPERARALEVQGGTAQAWIIDDKELLIRTRLTVLSPTYTSSMRSPDGMKVYRMPKTPLIMAAKDGNTYQLAISGY